MDQIINKIVFLVISLYLLWSFLNSQAQVGNKTIPENGFKKSEVKAIQTSNFIRFNIYDENNFSMFPSGDFYSSAAISKAKGEVF